MERSAGDKPKWSWVKAIGLAVVGILALVFGKGIGAAVYELVSSGYRESAKENALQEGLLQAVALLRKQTPIQVDEVTTLRDALATTDEIIYIMEVNADLDAAAIAEVKQELKVSNTRNVCGNPKTRTLLEYGATMTWQYTVNSGEQFRVSVLRCD